MFFLYLITKYIIIIVTEVNKNAIILIIISIHIDLSSLRYSLQYNPE